MNVIGFLKFKIHSLEEIAARQMVIRHYQNIGCTCRKLSFEPMQKGDKPGESFCKVHVSFERKDKLPEETLKVLFRSGKVHGVTHAT